MAHRNLRSTGAAAVILTGLAALTMFPPKPKTANVPLTPSASLPFDLGQVMNGVHFAFREDGQGWTGGHSTYRARVENGAVALTAFHETKAAPVEGTMIRLGATTIRRGDDLLTGAARPPQRDARGALELRRGAILEHLANTAGGLQQSWDFPTRPEGSGDLVVRVPVEGHFTGSSAQGLHFTSGALGFGYGHATWIDAAGTKTPVPARWDGTAVVMSVPEQLVDGSLFPAVLDPLVSPELSLDTPVYVAAPNNQLTPAVTFNGTNYLAVWIDGRNPGGTQRDLYGTRINTAGTALDPGGIFIAANADSNSAPAVATNGTDFMVVWQDYVVASSGPSSIAAARVTAAGVSLDPTGFAVASGSINSFDCQAPSIAWSSASASYLVVWDENDSGGGTYDVVRGQRVDANKVLQGTSFAISAASGFNSFPTVDSDGTNFLVVWHQNNATLDIYGARVSSVGVVVGAPFSICASAGNQYLPTVAWNGTTHLVAWYDNRTSANSDIYASRVSSAGVTTDPAGILVSNAANVQIDVKVTAQGPTGFFLTWMDLRSGAADIYGAQVTNAGVVSQPAGILISSAASSQITPAVASDGSNVLAVWADYRMTPPGNADLYGTRINSTGTVLTPAGTLYGASANGQATPAVAFDGTNYLVAWADQRGAASDLYGVRVSKAGVVLDAAGFVISNAVNNQQAPAIAWTGTNYFVAWQDDRTTSGNFDIYAARVTPAGTVLDASGILINNQALSQTVPTVASDGTSVLVAWQDERVIASSYDVYGTLVTGTTVVSPTGVVISAAGNRQKSPSAAWNGSTYFVAWEDLRNSSFEIWGSRVAANGTTTDGAGIAVSTGTTVNHFHPSVAAVGSTFFVAWGDTRVLASGMNIYGTRVTNTGVVSDPTGIALCTSAGDQQSPSVAGDGTNFQVTWQDHRNGAVNWDVYGARVVAATGATLDGQGFPISTATTDESAPAIVSSGSRSFLVAYQAFNTSPATNAIRVQARTLSNAPPVGTAGSLSTPEDTFVSFSLAGTDLDGDALTSAIVTGPTHGVLTGTLPNVTYTPAANYFGPDSITFKVNDGVVDSAPQTFSLSVTAVNDLPLPLAQSVSTPEDTTLPITLTGTDIEGSPLTFTVVNQPTHGSLSGTAPSLSYSPALNYNGPDSFTFRVNDGTADSLATATVSLTVTAVNDPPVATFQSVSTLEDTALGIVLSGTDVEGNPLSFSIVTAPPHGTLSGAPPNVTYTPALNYNGADAFSFKVNDGSADSAVQQVNVIVSPVNDAPVAQTQSVLTPQDTALVITLLGTDVDLDPLSYLIVTQPTHGTLSGGTAALHTYAPTPGYQGPDSFTFKVNDGTVDSPTVLVNISVNSVNHAPIATPQTVTTAEDTPKAITLAGTDQDGNTLTYSVTSNPLHGVLSGSGSALSYAPSLNYNGPDSFAFRVNDGSVDSLAATVSITVTPVNDPPTATSQSASTQEDSPLALTLTGADLDADPLTFVVTSAPSHGSLTGTPPSVSYLPAPNYNGPDAFSFKTNDGTVDSPSVGVVTLVVAAVNDAPVAQSQMVATPQDTPKFITLVATDVDLDLLFYTVVSSPTHGTLMGTPPSVTYVPAAGYQGADSFTFKASDGQQDSAVVTVSLSVASVNHAPVVAAQTITLPEDGSGNLTVAATDADGDAVTFSVVDAPLHGTLTGTGPDFTYTPAANFNGADFFNVKANDGLLDSVPAKITLTVTAVNDAPVGAPQTVTTAEDLTVPITLAGSDLDNAVLTFTVTQMPTHGQLSGAPPTLSYVPAANFNGADSLTFTVNDGTVDSAPVTVAITVTPVNDAPVAEALSLNVPHDTQTAVTLRGTDLESDGLTFAVVTPPEHGKLTGSGPDLTYTPSEGFGGADAFTYLANDGALDSAAATVTLTVAAGAGGGSGPSARTLAQVNGWSCGCNTSETGPGIWAVAGLLMLWLRRKPSVAAVAVVVALSLGSAAQAAKTKKAPAVKTTPAPAPAPAPTPTPTPPPAPAPVEVAQPAPPPAPVSRPSLAALEVAVTVPNEKLDGAAFTDMMVSAIDQGQLFKVISNAEIVAMLGAERQRQLLGCGEENSCMAELTDALGAQYLLQGSVGKVGENYVVTVRLIDSRKAQVIGRASLQTAEANLLLNTLWKATQQVVDTGASTRPPEEAKRWLERPREEPAAPIATERSHLGVAVTGVAGYQPLAAVGTRASIGGEVDLTWRIGRFDLGAGVVISPSPGARISAAFAVLATRSRIAVGLRGTAFPVAGLYGGGPAVTYEFAFTPNIGLRALVAGEVYGGAGPQPVVALLGGLGAEAHF